MLSEGGVWRGVLVSGSVVGTGEFAGSFDGGFVMFSCYSFSVEALS